ncbi:collagen binding domain-containing protein [Streptomyces sp. NPDC020858]|uniref:collagen binding domain-containing protein n=1 Tax=Streptomyces sp. NPDC020858 TaxID=3365097 RepID=UPI0037B901DB
MAARTARVWPLGLAAATVLAAAAPAHCAGTDAPPPAPPASVRPVVPSAGPSAGQPAAPRPAPPGSATVVLRTTDRDTGAPLPGARFELWRETNDQAGLQTGGAGADEKHDGAVCVSDARGSCTVALPVGETYYWLEAVAPAGYERPGEAVTAFDLGADEAEEGIVLDVTNRRRGARYSGEVRVLKKDWKTEGPLHGAVFELWRETNRTAGLQIRGINADHLVRPGCATDADGACDFDGLADGWYYLVETDVPEGYLLPEEPVTGPRWLDEETPDQRLVVTLYNKRDNRTSPPPSTDEDAEEAGEDGVADEVVDASESEDEAGAEDGAEDARRARSPLSAAPAE